MSRASAVYSTHRASSMPRRTGPSLAPPRRLCAAPHSLNATPRPRTPPCAPTPSRAPATPHRVPPTPIRALAMRSGAPRCCLAPLRSRPRPSGAVSCRTDAASHLSSAVSCPCALQTSRAPLRRRTPLAALFAYAPSTRCSRSPRPPTGLLTPFAPSAHHTRRPRTARARVAALSRPSMPHRRLRAPTTVLVRPSVPSLVSRRPRPPSPPSFAHNRLLAPSAAYSRPLPSHRRPRSSAAALVPFLPSARRPPHPRNSLHMHSRAPIRPTVHAHKLRRREQQKSRGVEQPKGVVIGKFVILFCLSFSPVSRRHPLRALLRAYPPSRHSARRLAPPHAVSHPPPLPALAVATSRHHTRHLTVPPAVWQHRAAPRAMSSPCAMSRRPRRVVAPLVPPHLTSVRTVSRPPSPSYAPVVSRSPLRTRVALVCARRRSSRRLALTVLPHLRPRARPSPARSRRVAPTRPVPAHTPHPPPALAVSRPHVPSPAHASYLPPARPSPAHSPVSRSLVRLPPTHPVYLWMPATPSLALPLPPPPPTSPPHLPYGRPCASSLRTPFGCPSHRTLLASPPCPPVLPSRGQWPCAALPHPHLSASRAPVPALVSSSRVAPGGVIFAPRCVVFVPRRPAPSLGRAVSCRPAVTTW
ncbi:hypothetical protein DENSPDRAFT_886495 [Dentipellis sp. KUC8613]|nr:hypothetical protein DENSPDRAFT_886495 [Dentipellis sp. KUC8613]